MLGSCLVLGGVSAGAGGWVCLRGLRLGQEQAQQSKKVCLSFCLKTGSEGRDVSLRVFCRVFQSSAAAKRKELRLKLVL